MLLKSYKKEACVLIQPHPWEFFCHFSSKTYGSSLPFQASSFALRIFLMNTRFKSGFSSAILLILSRFSKNFALITIAFSLSQPMLYRFPAHFLQSMDQYSKTTLKTSEFSGQSLGSFFVPLHHT